MNPPAGSWAGAVALALLAASWSWEEPVSSPDPHFTEVTESQRLHFRHDPGATGEYSMPEIMGSGAAFLDYDRDGDLDVYLV